MSDERIDMSSFEAQFDHQVSEFMDDAMFEKVADLNQRIKDLEDVLNWKKQFLKNADENLEQLEVMLKSLLEVVAEIRARKQPYADEKASIRQDMSGDQRKLDAANRELFRLMAEIAAQRKLAEMRREMDLKTIDAPWRQRALPHQMEGAYRLSSAKRAILGDQMGLGKTLQAIMTIDMMRGMCDAKKILIICPKPILDNFRREFVKWSPNQFVHVLNQTGKGLKSEILDLVAIMPECVILTNYEVWRRDPMVLEKLIHCGFDTVILDEAHVLQNPESTTAKTVKELVHAENKCMHCDARTFGASCPSCGQMPTVLYGNRSVKNVFPMTGTPILNKPQDIFTLLNLVDDKGFPNKLQFLEDFCMRKCANCHQQYCDCLDKPKWVWVFTTGGEAMLLKRLGMKFTARTRESAGVVMPPQEVIRHEFDFDPEKYPRQVEFVRKLHDEAILKFSGEVEITHLEALAWYTRIRQAATWPDGIRIKRYKVDQYGELVLSDEGKLIVVDEYRPNVGESIIMDEGECIIREAIENGNRIVVFSHFKEALKEMERRLNLEGISVVRYDGDLNEKARLEAQHDFDLTLTRPENAKFKVFLGQYKSAKVGLNLHGANEVLFLDREWNPGMEKQAMDRVRRIGSEFETIVHTLHVPGTATEMIDMIQEQKAAMLEGFETEVNIAEEMRKFLKGEK
jgi:SNF2 family DNA or RNA helicase